MDNKEKPYESLREDLLRKFEQISSLAKYCKKPQGGWLHSFGNALGLSHTQLATKLGISEKELTSFMEEEVKEEVIPENIKRLSSSLGGRFEYVFIPNNLSALKKEISESRSEDTYNFKKLEQLPSLPPRPPKGWIHFMRKRGG